MITAPVGQRKYRLGLAWLFVSSLEILAVVGALMMGKATGWDAAGLSSLLAAQAAGVSYIVYANMKKKANGAS